MRIIIRRPAASEADGSGFSFLSENRTYRLKSRSFVLSVLVHAAICAALLLQKNLPAQAQTPGRQIYETLIQPQEKKLVWYHLKKELPNIDSSTSRAKVGPNRGRIRSPQLVIADSKKGSKKQVVWQDTPVELKTDVKVQNLISLHPPAVLEAKALPPPPAPKPREFVPPPTGPQPQPAQPALIPLPLAPYAGANPVVPTAALPSVLEAGQMKVYRPFVAPPGQKGGTGTTAGTGTDNTAVPDAPNVGQPTGVNMAAINLDPLLGGASNLPPGRRPGNFSSGPNVGEPSAERSGRGTAMVPGLTTRGRNTTGDAEPVVKTEAPDPSIPKREVNYREMITRPVSSSLSVPLWPGARRIPAALDLQFRNRPVYTMVLPAPKMPQYAGDWVLWFSELKPTDTQVQIRSPLPEKKLVSDASRGIVWGSEADVRISLVIDETGHVQSISVSKIPPDLSPQIALDDVRAWQFKPATRNGVPIAVEAVLDIPYRRIVSTEPAH